MQGNIRGEKKGTGRDQVAYGQGRAWGVMMLADVSLGIPWVLYQRGS